MSFFAAALDEKKSALLLGGWRQSCLWDAASQTLRWLQLHLVFKDCLNASLGIGEFDLFLVAHFHNLKPCLDDTFLVIVPNMGCALTR